MSDGIGRLVTNSGMAVLLVATVMIAGCAGGPPGTAGSGGPAPIKSAAASSKAIDASASPLTPLSEVPTLPPVAKRLTDVMAQNDQYYVRVKDMSSVRKTYGIDVSFPAQAAGGKLAGLWMQIPDVDGGYAWALYDTSLVEVTVWIAPTVAKAKIGRWYDGSTMAATSAVDVNGHQAVTVSRVWEAPQRIRVPGSLPPGTPGFTPARWSAAVVSWAQGQCVVTVASDERDVADLLPVAREIKITGTVRMPKPVKAKKK